MNPSGRSSGPHLFEQLKQALHAQYELIQELGRGGMGVVFLAYERALDRRVAIKAFVPRESDPPHMLSRFRREARTAALLSHPGIVPIFSVGETADGQAYFVMAYVEGETLEDRLARKAPFSIQEAVSIAAQLGQALDYAHSRKVVHRDVKPANVLLEKGSGRVLLTDFGIAKAREGPDAATLTATGHMVGTPAYMSPEHLDKGQVDPRSDQYSLAVIVYEMLAGERPFKGPNTPQYIRQHLLQAPPPLSALRPELPPHAIQAVERALHKEQTQRWGSCEAFVAAVGGAVSPAAPAAARPSLLMRALVGGSYLALAGLSLEMAKGLADRGIVPNWAFPTLLLLLIAGLPLALLLVWVGEGTGVARMRRWPRWVEQVRGGHVLGVLGALLIALMMGRVFLARGTQSSQPLAAAAGLNPQRVAVLYLDDHSEGRANRHLADAFTEALIHDLVQIEALEVLPKSAVKPYQNTEVPLDSVAITLRAGTLVEGSLLGTEEWLMVNVQLIDAATMTVLESIEAEGTRVGPRTVLDSLANHVSRILRTELGVEFERRERKAETESDEAWELVQLAKRLREDALSSVMAADTSAAGRALDRGDSLLEHAEELDPEWLLPIVERAEVARVRARLLVDKPGTYNPEWTRVGIAHADRALERERDNAAALELRGFLRFYLATADTAAASELLADAERDLGAAVTADPASARAWSWLSRVYLQSGRLTEAKQAAERAYEADPFLALDLIVIFGLCDTALQLQELDQAERWCKEGRRHYPDEPGFVAAELTLLAGYVGPDPNVHQAWTLAEALQELSPPQQRPALKPSALYYVAAVLARSGLADSARAVLRQGRAADTLNDPQTAYYEANVHLQLGEEMRALRLLADYLQAFPSDRSFIAKDWWWWPLRDDPAFKELVATHE